MSFNLSSWLIGNISIQLNPKDCVNKKGVHLNTDDLELFYNLDLGNGKRKRKQWADYTINEVIIIWWVGTLYVCPHEIGYLLFF